MIEPGPEEMVQWLRACVIFAKGLSWVPRTDVRRRTSTCNFSSEWSDILFWPLHALHLYTQHPDLLEIKLKSKKVKEPIVN